MLSCPQACRKCCSNDDHFQFTTYTYQEKEKKCTWINTDTKRENYCSTIHFGALVANKCPINCGICEITESPTTSAIPTIYPTITPSTEATITPSTEALNSLEFRSSNTYETCADSAVFRIRGDPIKTCDWISRNADRVENLCPNESIALNCPQACRKCCGDDVNFRVVTTDDGTLKMCTWLAYDPNAPSRFDRYCDRVQTGSLISAKCPVSCQVCGMKASENFDAFL